MVVSASSHKFYSVTVTENLCRDFPALRFLTSLAGKQRYHNGQRSAIPHSRIFVDIVGEIVAGVDTAFEKKITSFTAHTTKLL